MLEQHNCDERYFREFFFQGRPNNETVFRETDRGNKRRIVNSDIVLLEPQICRQNCRQLSVFSNPASQSQPGRCDDRNSALKWQGGRRETYEIAFSLYFREINKRCTICLLLPRSVSTDDFERKFAKYRSSLGWLWKKNSRNTVGLRSQKNSRNTVRHNYADQHSFLFDSSQLAWSTFVSICLGCNTAEKSSE